MRLLPSPLFRSALARSSTKTLTPLSAVHGTHPNVCYALGTTRYKASASIASEHEANSSVSIPLVSVPKLPLAGSMIPAFSKTPMFDNRKVYEYFPGIRERHGPFYSFGFPGIGDGIKGEMIIVTDPNEMLKVLRAEGSFPFGFIQAEWTVQRWLKNIKSPIVHGHEDGGFFGNGETWRRLRLFVQKDLFSPISAKGYIPGMVEAAKSATAAAPANSANMNMFLPKCSLDLFTTVMFGEITNIASGTGPSTAATGIEATKENEDLFLSIKAIGSTELLEMVMSPYEIAMAKAFDVTTSRFKKFEDVLTKARNICREKIMRFIERKKSGEPLSPVEANSYLAQAVERQEKDGETSIEEMVDLSMVLLIAAVDNTSAIMYWILVHLALNPEVQSKLHEELRQSLKAHGGEISEATLNRTSVPYLHAVMRESHRLTPAIFLGMAKRNVAAEVELHGHRFPKNTIFGFEGYSTGLQKDLVPDAESFIPERWSDEEVEARKGTDAEVLDHPLLRDAFSYGARKCPGSRVANYETLSLLASLVLEYDMSIQDENINSLKDVEYQQQATIVPINITNFHFEPRSK